MTYRYFACDWLIRASGELNTLDMLRRLTDEANCGIAVLLLTWRTDGCYIMRFVFQAPSRHVLDECLSKLAKPMDLENWRPAKKAEFIEAAESMDTPGALPWAERNIEELGQYNEALLTGTPMWVTFRSVAHPLSPSDLEQVFKILDRWNCNVFYHEPKLEDARQGRAGFLFIARVTSVSRFEQFVIELQPFLDITGWFWLYRPTRHEPDALLTLDAVRFSEAQPLTRESAEKFLQLARVFGRANENDLSPHSR